MSSYTPFPGAGDGSSEDLGPIKTRLASIEGDVEALKETGVGAPGASAFQVAVDEGFEGDEAAWLESLKGAPGVGTKGDTGASAYQVAVDEGFSGDEAAWIASLQGAPGVGTKGDTGASAYRIAQDAGFSGDEVAWLASLIGRKGDDGKTAFQIAQAAGFSGTEAEWLTSLVGRHGDPGASAYQIALDNGFSGSAVEWLASLVGRKGDAGPSAYQVALDAGFQGDRVAWLASLQGQPGIGLPGGTGKSAYQLAADEGFDGTEPEWIASLIGRKGDDGRSAYQVAVVNGFVGSEIEWLASLKGEDGDGGTSSSIIESRPWILNFPTHTSFPNVRTITLRDAGVEVSDALTLSGALPSGPIEQTLTVSSGDLDTPVYDWLSVLTTDGLTLITMQSDAVELGGVLYLTPRLALGIDLDGSSPSEEYEVTFSGGFVDVFRRGDAIAGFATYAAGRTTDVFDPAFNDGLEATIANLKGAIGELLPIADGVTIRTGLIKRVFDVEAAIETGVGETGASAYDVAVDNGFTGDEATWLVSLIGEKGDDGRSAYQVAQAAGFAGTEGAWLASLIGAGGKSAYEVAVAGGYSGSRSDWLTSLRGPSGKSAFEVAQAGGYAGTQAQWLASLVGAPGKSAYDVAVANGFQGTQAAWLTSLQGASGQGSIVRTYDHDVRQTSSVTNLDLGAIAGGATYYRLRLYAGGAGGSSAVSGAAASNLYHGGEAGEMWESPWIALADADHLTSTIGMGGAGNNGSNSGYSGNNPGSPTTAEVFKGSTSVFAFTAAGGFGQFVPYANLTQILARLTPGTPLPGQGLRNTLAASPPKTQCDAQTGRNRPTSGGGSHFPTDAANDSATAVKLRPGNGGAIIYDRVDDRHGLRVVAGGEGARSSTSLLVAGSHGVNPLPNSTGTAGPGGGAGATGPGGDGGFPGGGGGATTNAASSSGKGGNGCLDIEFGKRAS